MSDTTKISIVVLCIDYRFWPQALPLLEAKYGPFDLIEIAGAAKNLLAPLEEDDRVVLLENIQISINLHHPDRLVLTNHTDCGAYGGSGQFKSRAEEIKFHKTELRKAAVIAKKEFPQLKVEILVIDKDNQGQILLIEA